jgi:hypothetical protein
MAASKDGKDSGYCTWNHRVDICIIRALDIFIYTPTDFLTVLLFSLNMSLSLLRWDHDVAISNKLVDSVPGTNFSFAFSSYF